MKAAAGPDTRDPDRSGDGNDEQVEIEVEEEPVIDPVRHIY